MSARLGVALARHIQDLPGTGKFVLVEGVTEELAEAMVSAWGDASPPLVIASLNPGRFGAHALVGVSGTSLRNKKRYSDGRDDPGGAGVCVVICEGAQLPDRQSLRSFASVAPGDLLKTATGLTHIAQAEPAAPLDGPARDVRHAIVQAGDAARPGAAHVAAYLDRCAAGEPPMRALPALGAFADHAVGRPDVRRILANLSLAARRGSEQPARPADLRRRAERVLARRPGLDIAAARREADRVVALLQSGDDALLSLLTYDEAVEILDQRSSDLPTAALRELRFYQQTRGSDDDVAWDRYEDAARDLSDAERQKQAARDLLGFDQLEAAAVFETSTRRRLEQLLKDRVVSASRPSCPELALLRCAIATGGIGSVELTAPIRTPGGAENRSGAVQELALACCRLRLGRLLRDLEQNGATIDGALLLPADAAWPAIFEDAQLDSGPGLPTVQMRIRSTDGNESRTISWRPDLDDVATLRAALAFAEQPTLSLRATSPPTLRSFCSGPPPSPEAVPPPLLGAARALQETAIDALRNGLNPAPLRTWTERWQQAVENEERLGRPQNAEALGLAGAVATDGPIALTPFAPLKAEWLSQYLEGLWSLTWVVQHAHGDTAGASVEETAMGIARSTAAHYPAHLRRSTSDRVMLPGGEGRIWSVYGGDIHETGEVGGEALTDVITRLLALQPEAAGHLRCLAYGPGAATLLVEQAIALAGRRIGRAVLRKLEIFCVEDEGGRPSPESLARADDAFAGETERPMELRFLPSLAAAQQMLARHAPAAPAVHLALVTGLTDGGNRLTIESPEVDPPPQSAEVLFAPRTWTRPRQTRRVLLMPPAATGPGGAWLRLMNAVEDEWPEPGDQLRVPELRTASSEVREPLLAIHDLALWVATLDPYASRDSLTYAMGGEVAILHQDRRLGGDSPLSLVISQKSGGPADRGVGRSLRAAGIVDDFTSAVEIGGALRKVASEGYGVLALEAATTGAGINELVGHVVAFSLLATRTTPWPLPPNCRVLLVSLDDYKHWFPAKRADLLVLALDPAEGGVHVAAIEVKARRSDGDLAARDALDQLRQTLHATRYAAYPERNSVHSRLWLNRLTEAACAVARESNFRLDATELEALERFRAGDGTLEWAGLGLVFGPTQADIDRHYHQAIAGDRIPIVVHSVRLTEELLREAAGVSLPELRTVEAARPPLEGGRVRRRPERAGDGERSSGVQFRAPAAPDDASGSVEENLDCGHPRNPSAVGEDSGTENRPREIDSSPTSDPAGAEFVAPLLGWDASTGDAVHWRAAGPNAELDNGHTEIWGASGAGKTQFTMSLLAQLAAHSGTKFGIADFKNDYSDDGSDRFPERTGARFLDLWNDGAPFNPLALADSNSRETRRAIIELRDIVDVAAQSFTRLGIRQKDKLRRALEQAYDVGRGEGRWPTLLTLDDQLDEDLRGVIGDLTREEIFKDGPPLGDAIDENLVFGLYEIPGNGLTTVLAAGFILSALHLKIQSLPQVANTVRYVAVVDEAHRVASFKAVKSMLREGRSKGLAVLLATQQPGDLPDEVATNANTRICFRLPDATIAAAAARRLNASDPSLAEQIRTLERGEAFVSLAGATPRLLRMAQFWRDRSDLRIADRG